MLKPVKIQNARPINARFAIVASRYNARYVKSMVEAAVRELKRAGTKHIQIIRVPGAFEIPAVAARLLKSNQKFDAIICLGIILRGQTVHAQQIGDAVCASLAQLQVQHAVPVVHEVLLLESEEQAKVRCLDPEHNRGAEAAHTALEMARVMRALE
jgi:6,7-dimethyl-8-ribityllumazine synthase